MTDSAGRVFVDPTSVDITMEGIAVVSVDNGGSRRCRCGSAARLWQLAALRSGRPV